MRQDGCERRERIKTIFEMTQLLVLNGIESRSVGPPPESNPVPDDLCPLSETLYPGGGAVRFCAAQNLGQLHFRREHHAEM